MALADLSARWIARADELAPYAPAAAEAFRRAAVELEAAQRAADDEVLSLADAAAVSGYSSETLRHMVSRGRIPNAGRRGAPRIRRADLPRQAPAADTKYSPAADALSIIGRTHGQRPAR
jgi:hypothetical protein